MPLCICTACISYSISHAQVASGLCGSRRGTTQIQFQKQSSGRLRAWPRLGTTLDPELRPARFSKPVQVDLISPSMLG